MIKSVHLVNWRSHKDTKLDFTKGTNLLVGIMGSGKSSVFEGICFAFFGKFPALASRKVKLSQLHSQFAASDETLVEVEFEVNGKVYRVIRKILGNKSVAELREGNQLVETKSEAVNRMVEHLLGIDYDLYVRAIYAEQNSIDYFLNISPSERKKQIDNLMGIDRYEKLRAMNTKAINRIKELIRIRERDLMGMDKSKVESELNNYRRQLEDVNRQISEANEQLKSANSRRVELEDSHKRLSEVKSKVELLQRDADQLKGKRVMLEEELEKGVDDSQLEDKTRQLEQVKSEIYRVKDELEKLEREELSISKEIAVLKKVLDEVEERKREVEDLDNRLKALELPDVDLDEVNGRIKGLNDQLNAVNAEKVKLKSQLDEYSRRLEELRSKVKDVESLEVKLKEMRGITHREVEDLKKVRDNVKEWMGSLREIIKINREAVEKLEVEGSVCPVCEAPLSPEKKKELIEKKMQNVEGSEEELKNKEQELGELESKIKTLEDQLKVKSEIEGKLSAYSGVREEFEKVKDEYKKIIDQWESSNFEETVKELERKIGYWEDVRTKLEESLKLKVRLNEGRAFISENSNKSQELAEKESKLKDITSKIDGLKKDLERLREDSNRLEMEIKEIQRIKAVREELKSVVSRIESINRELETLKFDPQQLEMIEGELRNVIGEINGLSARISGLKDLESSVRSGLENQEKLFNQIVEMEKEIDKFNQIHARLESFGEAVLETQANLRNHLVDAVNEVLAKVWNSLYPYNDLTAVKLEATDKDYSILLERNGEWISVDGNVSGGERASAALAVRIALSIVLVPNLSMIVLDEPTHNLDVNGVQSLTEILREKLPTIVEQAFVITHDEGLKEGASGKLYIFAREKGRMEPTKILMEEIV